jgi:CheY-like chemotaxis protein
VDLNFVVESVSMMLRRLIGENVRLVTRAGKGSKVVKADPGQLEQVLVNLAVNSRDAMPGGGVLEIEVTRVADSARLRPDIRGPGVLLTVADTGVGMDQATAVRAFEPFFTTKEPGLGTGLGLATVYGIVGQSGGQVWVESAPGSGTKVFVLLPAADVPAEVAEVAPARTVESGRCAVILVVEDDPAVRGLVVAALEHAGHRVLVASSPAEATALSDGLADQIDLLLSDVVMPGGTGPELAERLIAHRPSLRVLLMSGYDSPFPKNLSEQGFVFLAKPFGADQLRAAVVQVLGETGI